MNYSEAQAKFRTDRPWFEARGVFVPGATSYLPDEFRHNADLAMDAMPTLTTDPNSGVPAMLTTFIDPAIYEIVFAPTKAAEVLGEQKKGDWLTDTVMFPVVEHTGEVSSYDDYSEQGRAGANTNWPQRQNYVFQTVLNYGDREVERAGLGRINWIAEIEAAGADILNRYTNHVYLFGVQGLQNYGLTNDPNLPAALAPATKANTGVTWFTAGGAPNATANEVYNDIVALFAALVNANNGNVDKSTPMTLAMSPGSEVALTFTNSFNVNVEDLLKKNFPNLKVVSIPQYGTGQAEFGQGISAGNLVQLVADEIMRQKTGFCAFSEKMRSHPIVRQLSSWKKKITAGAWGTVVSMPVAFSQMIGV
jgi:hypothetical protein